MPSVPLVRELEASLPSYNQSRILKSILSQTSNFGISKQESYGISGFDTTNFAQMQKELDSYTEEEAAEMWVLELSSEYRLVL